MSVQAMGWAIEQQIVLDPHARHVLLCLANYADHLGRSAFPSASTLMRDTGMSRSTLFRRIAMLEEAAVIRLGNQKVAAVYIERGDRRPVCYDLLMHPSDRTSEKDADSGCQGDTPNDDAGCQGDTSGVSGRHERGVRLTPNPSLNRHRTVKDISASQSVPSKAKKAATPKTAIADDFAISECVREWAAENGHTQLEKHFAAFVLTCKAKGYRYADWDAAFMNAIRGDWAKLGAAIGGAERGGKYALAAQMMAGVKRSAPEQGSRLARDMGDVTDV